jgi:nucleoside-diphosphate-sugar epimerase
MRAGVASAVAATEGSYVYASSYMALGMRQPGARLRQTLLSRTSYGAVKRRTEREVTAAGTRHHRPVYVLRLGQVHGEMQQVSKKIMKSMRSEPTLVPAGPSNTVFIYAIAEALLSIAAEKEIPGRYSLVSVPQWTWKELHTYFARRCGVDPTIIEEPESASVNPVQAGAVALGKMLAPVALRHRDLLTAYVLASHRALELKAKASHLRRSAAAEISEWAASRHFRPYDGAFKGVVPDPPLRTLSDSRSTMEPYIKELRLLLAEIGEGTGGSGVPTQAKDAER